MENRRSFPTAKKRKQPEPLDDSGLRAYAGRLLSTRTLSINELRTKLKARAASFADVDAVIGYLKENNFINDERFAETFANWRRDNEGFGKGRVVRDLMARRVAPALAKEAAESAFAQADEVQLIEQFLARKYRGKDLSTLLKEEKHLASAFRRLRTAGFSSGNSIKVLKRIASQQSLNDELLEDLANAPNLDETTPESEWT